MNDAQMDYFIDITAEICPMTFVRAKLLIERAPLNQLCVIRLSGDEPLANVPRSLNDLGHEIVSLEPEDRNTGELIAWRLIVRKRY
jgi:TusA-related sulfurtransferase